MVYARVDDLGIRNQFHLYSVLYREPFYRVAAGNEGETGEARGQLMDPRFVPRQPFAQQVQPFPMTDNLDAQWTVDRERLAALKAQSWPLRETSALSGDGVENAFIRLGQQLLHAV